MDPQIDLINRNIGPDAGDQRILADDLAGVLNQGDQYVKCPATQRHGPVAIQQEPLRWNELKRSECEYLPRQGPSSSGIRLTVNGD
jgi:hypothetical protein